MSKYEKNNATFIVGLLFFIFSFCFGVIGVGILQPSQTYRDLYLRSTALPPTMPMPRNGTSMVILGDDGVKSLLNIPLPEELKLKHTKILHAYVEGHKACFVICETVNNNEELRLIVRLEVYPGVDLKTLETTK